MTRRTVRVVDYEWDLESLDEYGDIIDHRHSDTFPGVPTEDNIALVLIRDVGVGISGEEHSFTLDDRAWAYVVDGKLPAQFDNGVNVPKRFFKEMQK
jgi:hypothetical protein